MCMAKTMDLGLQEALQAFLGEGNGCVVQSGDGPYVRGKSAAVLAGSSSRQLAARLRSDGFTNVQEFALLPSARTTRWIIPIGDSQCTSSGLNVYAPYAYSARVLKRLLLAVAKTGLVRLTRHKVLVISRNPLNLELLVSEVTGEPHPVFALSLGAPSSFRKLTIQVMRPDGSVLGYVKLPMTLEADGRIRREATMLERLRSFASLRSQIPRVLHAGVWGDGYILFQSAGPTSPAPVQFAPHFQNFLNKLRSIEQVERSGDALVNQVGARWRIVQ